MSDGRAAKLPLSQVFATPELVILTYIITSKAVRFLSPSYLVPATLLDTYYFFAP